MQYRQNTQEAGNVLDGRMSQPVQKRVQEAFRHSKKREAYRPCNSAAFIVRGRKLASIAQVDGQRNCFRELFPCRGLLPRKEQHAFAAVGEREGAELLRRVERKVAASARRHLQHISLRSEVCLKRREWLCCSASEMSHRSSTRMLQEYFRVVKSAGRQETNLGLGDEPPAQQPHARDHFIQAHFLVIRVGERVPYHFATGGAAGRASVHTIIPVASIKRGAIDANAGHANQRPKQGTHYSVDDSVLGALLASATCRTLPAKSCEQQSFVMLFIVSISIFEMLHFWQVAPQGEFGPVLQGKKQTPHSCRK